MADLFHGPTTVHFTFVLMAFLGERRALLLRQFSKSIFVSIVLKTSFLKESFILKCFLLFSISHPLNMGDTYLFMWVVGHSWTWKQLSLSSSLARCTCCISNEQLQNEFGISKNLRRHPRLIRRQNFYLQSDENPYFMPNWLPPSYHSHRIISDQSYNCSTIKIYDFGVIPD